MQKVVIGSTNPVKTSIVEEVFSLVFSNEDFEFVTCAAESGVPDQPFGDSETRRGAYNRAIAGKTECPDAQYYVGVEGGIEERDDTLWVFAWMCTLDTNGKEGFGRTGSFCLPEKMSALIHKGMELGDATDSVFNALNSKQKGGAIGILTNDLVTRKDFYKDAMIFSLLPYTRPDLYQTIETRRIPYRKLVRDKIPAYLESQSIPHEKHVADDAEYRLELIKKLHEEAVEFSEAGAVEELADVMEVVDALRSLPEYADVLKIQEAKRAEKGAFNERFIVRGEK